MKEFAGRNVERLTSIKVNCGVFTAAAYPGVLPKHIADVTDDETMAD